MEVLVYALVGLTAGVLGSMLGVGGGILMVPAMVYFCGVPFKPAAAMSLAVMIPMALASTIQNLCRSDVRPTMAEKFLPILLMAALAIGGTFLGMEISKHLTGTTLKRIFAVIMVLAAVKMFLDKDKPAAAKEGAGAATASAPQEVARP